MNAVKRRWNFASKIIGDDQQPQYVPAVSVAPTWAQLVEQRFRKPQVTGLTGGAWSAWVKIPPRDHKLEPKRTFG